MARENASVKIELLHGSPLDCLDELVTLAEIQRARVLTPCDKERATGRTVVRLNKIMNDYRNLLLDVQKIRFDLGLDEYKRDFQP